MIIYKVQNKINGKCYIGQTIYSLKKRKLGHIQKANKGSKYQFHYAIRKYGIENFTWSILETCIPEKLDEREQYYVEKYNTYKKGYNMTLGGDNPMNVPELRKKVAKNKIGKIRSEETKEKIRRTLKGRKNPEHSKWMSSDNNPAKRPEVREKMSLAHSGEKHPNAKNWLLISPIGAVYLFCGNLKNKIKEITGYTHYTIWYNNKGKYKEWILKEV